MATHAQISTNAKREVTVVIRTLNAQITLVHILVLVIMVTEVRNITYLNFSIFMTFLRRHFPSTRFT